MAAPGQAWNVGSHRGRALPYMHQWRALEGTLVANYYVLFCDFSSRVLGGLGMVLHPSYVEQGLQAVTCGGYSTGAGHHDCNRQRSVSVILNFL